MTDVYAIFGTLLALGIIFPGMLTAWWLLFPNRVELAHQRLEATPWRSFFAGVGAAVAAAISISILFAIPLPFASFLGALLLFTVLAAAGIGAAGIASLMAERLQIRSGDSLNQFGAFIRAAVALELMAAFPLIGWLLIIPVTLLVSLGAASFALFRWMPKAKPADAEPQAIAQPAKG